VRASGRKSRGARRQAPPPRVPPAAAAVASVLLPGLGQVLNRLVQRGLLLLGSVVTVVLMLGWRVSLLAHREPTPWAMLRKALGRRPFFIGLILACLAGLWAWIVVDAARLARRAKPGGTAGGRARRGGFGIFVLVLFTLFALGWQVSQVDLVRMVTEFPKALTPLGRVVWPWQAAVVREKVNRQAAAEIETPCTPNPPAAPVEKPGQPYLRADPTCGELSSLDEAGNMVKGSTLTLTGRGFAPSSEVGLYWVDPLGNEFQLRQEGKYLAVKTDARGAFTTDVVMPYRLFPGNPGEASRHQVVARQTAALGKLKASEPLLLTIERMVETIFMGMMATLFGILFAIPVSFLAARNLMSGSWITMGIYYGVRTIMNVIRAIEPLIWALIAVVWVGLGPFAGIIALTVHSVASLGKLYSEAIEGIDPGPIEAVEATGATRLQTIMYAVVPQMIAPFVSFSIYRWDINVRMSTIIGLVGGGGIGFLLVQYIRLLDYRAAGIAVWFIAVTVAVLDYVSAEIRARFV
jgi:phosphonate transport system permease protein